MADDTGKQVNDVITNRLRQVNTAIPGRVEKYDATTRKADVQPLIKESYADGTILSQPVITNVPVVMPSTSGAGLALPVAVGDLVLLVFSQRSIDLWAATGGETTAEDVRMHSMSDAIAIAGLFDFTVSHSDGNGVVLYNGAVKIRLTSDGKVAIGTVAVELLDEITKALDEIQTLSTTWGAVATQVGVSSTAIKTIKGSI